MISLLVTEQELSDIQDLIGMKPIVTGLYYYKHHVCPVYEFNDGFKVALLKIPAPVIAPVLWYETVKPWMLTKPDMIKHVSTVRR